MDKLPFEIGDILVHTADPYKERHEIVDMKMLPTGDGSGRMIIKSERTGECMPLIISRIGLAGWKKAQ